MALNVKMGIYMPLPEYLKKNVSRIKNQQVQDLGNWSTKYDAQEFRSFDIIGELQREFPRRKILREGIIRPHKKTACRAGGKVCSKIEQGGRNCC